MGTGSLLHAVKNSMQVLHSLCSLHSRNIEDRVGASALARMRAAVMIFSDAYDLMITPSLSEPAELLPLTSFLNRALVRIKAAHFGGITRPKMDLTMPDEAIPMQQITAWALLLNELVGQLALLNGDCPDAELTVSGVSDGPVVVLTIGIEASPQSKESTHDDSIEPHEDQFMISQIFGPVSPALIRQTSAMVDLISRRPPQLRIELPIKA
jgi:hypothetical protein